MILHVIGLISTIYNAFYKGLCMIEGTRLKKCIFYFVCMPTEYDLCGLIWD